MSFRKTYPLLSQKSKSKSAAWAARQHRDPFVKKRVSDPLAFRARSAFKLLEINDRWGQFLDQPDVHSVVDLGAAPGGWSQVVASKFGWTPTAPEVAYLVGRGLKEEAQGEEGETEGDSSEEISDPENEPNRALRKRWKKNRRAKKSEPESLIHYDPLDIDDFASFSPSTGRGKIVAVDLLPITPIPGVQTLKADFLLSSTKTQIQQLLATPENPRGKADVILSDMAANSSGNVTHDIQSSLEICEAVFEFARFNLRSADSIGRRKGGVLLMKFFAHPLLEKFRVETLESYFSYVYYVKPESSRSESREGYFLCQGWNP